MKAIGVCLLLTAGLGALPIADAAAAEPSAVQEIRDLFDRDMLRTARLKLEALLAAAPDSAPAYALLAEFRLGDRDWDAAETAARRAVELDNRNPRAWMLWGTARFEQGRHGKDEGKPEKTVNGLLEQAELGFRRVRSLDPDDRDALWRIGWVKEWQGDGNLAWQFYDAQLEEFPFDPGGYRRLGALRARQGKPAEAIALFDRGLEDAGDDAELLYLRALVLEEQGDREPAIGSLVRSVRADPDYERSWERLEDRVDPIEVLVPLSIEILKEHPAAAIPARRAGAWALHREPREGEKPWTHYEHVLDYVLPALERHGDDEALYQLAFPAAMELFGETARNAPSARRAVDAFARIHRAYAWSGDAANNLGFYFRELKRYDESLAWYLMAVERAPENQDILNDAGLMYLFHFPDQKEKGLPLFLKTVALVAEGDQRPERGYWDALENLCKHYWEVDRQPEKVVEYARMRYETTKGVKPYNMSRVAARYADRARGALRK